MHRTCQQIRLGPETIGQQRCAWARQATGPADLALPFESVRFGVGSWDALKSMQSTGPPKRFQSTEAETEIQSTPPGSCEYPRTMRRLVPCVEPRK